MVQQCNVPVDSRINALEMDLRLCEQQIAGYDNALVSLNLPFIFQLGDKCGQKMWRGKRMWCI